jgi:hypothetical protein
MKISNLLFETNISSDLLDPIMSYKQDLSGKHGVLKGNGPAKTPLAVYYDSTLALTYSRRGILGKSIVIRDPTGTAVACGK